jgi:hypothetical protein
MRKFGKIVVIVLAAGFAAIQFIRPERVNPPIVQAQTIEAAGRVPPDIQQVLARSCNDCHSHRTIYPWYSNVAPASWFLASHVADGRQHLNFSVWNTYTAQQKIRKLEEICEEVGSGAMPLPSYLWIHRGAVLEESEARAMCDWANAEREYLESTTE